MIKKDLKGKVFGELTVLSEIPERTARGHVRWLCRCSCGKEYTVLSTHLVSHRTLSCGHFRKLKGQQNRGYKGYFEISGDHWDHLKRNAIKRRLPIEFSVTIEYLWDLFLKQDRKCALSGLPLKFPLGKRDTFTASLDRIDNSKGYIQGNVQWLHKDINKMKNTHDQEYFIKLCLLVANISEGPKCELQK